MNFIKEFYTDIKLFFRFRKFSKEFNKLNADINKFHDNYYMMTPEERIFEHQCFQEDLAILIDKYKDIT